MPNSASSNVLYSNEIFKQYLIQLSTGIVWKNTSRANASEPEDVTDLYRSELFIVANRGLLNFEVVKSFPRAVLLNAGVPEAEVEVYATDKQKIPQYLRSAIIAEYTKALTSKDPEYGRPAYYNNITGEYEIIYDEPNNYYRMLMGLPDIGDYDYVYNSNLKWDTKTPIHEMTLIDRLEMEAAGVLDELLEKYPDKEYIRHLGKRYIDPFRARVADRFEMLYHNDSVSDTLNTDFCAAYNSARRMVLSVYYNKSLQKANNLYDNFLAMCILFMTLQSMQYKYLQIDITRDFYDTESLKLVYDSYGVPFHTEIPLEYHRRIVKNINKLISYKGSSQVFFDLFDIFDLGTMDIYSYFLTKTHLLDAKGNPLFVIKKDEDGNDIYDDEGNPVLDSSNYEIKFSKVKIYDDPALSISDNTNDVEYEVLTEPDPYWIEDASLIEKLTTEDFNYLESKYIGIQTIFDLMKITYENAYIFRMVTDNSELTKKMEFRWSDLGITCNLYDIFIYLASLYCRHFGYEGIIADKIPALMDTLGYDFEKSYEILHSAVLKNPHFSKNTKLLNLLTNLEITNMNSINTTYDQINKIRDLLIEGYTNAKSVEEFHAYRELYNTLLISKEIASVYTDPSTGEIYETFTDILADSRPELMQRYLLLHDTDVEDEILVVITQMETMLTNLKYLALSSGIGSSSMIDSLFKILNFFKSAKSELVGYNILYTITMRGINFFKMIDKIMLCVTENKIQNKEHFIDIARLIYDMIRHKNEITRIREEITDINSRAYLTDYIEKANDMIIQCTEIVEHLFMDNVWYIDFIQEMKIQCGLSSTMLMSDISNPELIWTDIVEARYKGLIKDNIMRLTDLLREDPTVPEIYILIDLHDSIDRLKTIIDSIKMSKDSVTFSDVLEDDLYSTIDNSKLSDIESLYDLIMLIASTDFELKDDMLSDTDVISISNIYDVISSIRTFFDNLYTSDDIVSLAGSICTISDSTVEQFFNVKVIDKTNSVVDDIRRFENNSKTSDSQSTEDIVNSVELNSSGHDFYVVSDALFEYDSDGNMKAVT